MEHRQVEPLFVLFTLLALVACVSRFVPASAQGSIQAPTPTPTSVPASLPEFAATPEPLPTLWSLTSTSGSPDQVASPVQLPAAVPPTARAPTLGSP
jgi:hypothetical protein